LDKILRKTSYFEKLNQKTQKKQIIYQIDTWKYNSQKCLLKSTDEENQLAKLQNDLLILFIENPKTLLSRDFLINKLWGNKIVNEEALSRLVAELRKLLKDSATKPKYIKTHPKKGYEFIHDIEIISKLGIKKNKLSLLSWGLLFLILNLVIYSAYFYSDTQKPNQIISKALATSKRVTASPGMESQPQLSNNGKLLAYIKRDNNKSIIMIESRLDGSLQKIESDFYYLSSPTISNNNQYVAVAAIDGDKCQIMIHSLITHQKNIISSCQIKNNSKILSWSNDDTKLYYVDLEYKFQTNCIWELDIASQKSRQITFPTSTDLFDSNPNMSPEGNYLSFNRGNHSVQNIFLLDTQNDPKNTINLTNDQNYSVSHDWYDNETLIYDSDKTGDRKLWLLNVHSNENFLLGARGAQFPSISRLTNQLAYQIAEYEANIWMLDLVTQKQDRLIHSTKYDNNPVFNHQGSQFAFTSNREEHGVIYLYDFKNHKEVKIFELAKTKLTRPTWSDDDSSIIASGNSLSGYWSFEKDLISGNFRKIPFNQENFSGFYFQGEIYALSKPSLGQSNLLKMDSNNNTIELPLKGISRILPVNDSHFIISKANKNGLFLVDNNDFSITPLIDDFPSSYVNFWTATGSELYYVNKDSNFSIWKYNITTKNTTKVTDSFPNSVGPSLSVSPDQSKILITKTDRAESDVFIAELSN
jgi:Tol biopolymer transport system component/DNA-binding winged helix-turn-helix (wHTH) protein